MENEVEIEDVQSKRVLNKIFEEHIGFQRKRLQLKMFIIFLRLKDVIEETYF